MSEIKEYFLEPGFVKGLLLGMVISELKKDKKPISESQAAKRIPGVKDAKMFREKFVLIDNPLIDPIITGAGKFYYDPADVDELVRKMKKKFNPIEYLKRNRRR